MYFVKAIYVSKCDKYINGSMFSFMIEYFILLLLTNIVMVYLKIERGVL